MKKLSLESVKNGLLCLTFDDRNFAGWLAALPLFEAYGAHVSFFLSGEMDETALSAAQALFAAGHTVGLHGRHHLRAPAFFAERGGDAYVAEEIAAEYAAMTEAGISVASFGYPYNNRNPETDRQLGAFFSHFRAGFEDIPDERLFLPPDRLPGTRVLHGFGVGTHYNTVESELLSKLDRAAAENKCLTLYSHNICPGATGVHMPTELLTAILTHAKTLGMQMVGFDELP